MKGVKKVKKVKEEKNLKTVAFIVVVAIIIILFLTGYSLGKSITESFIKANTSVAEPILVVDSDPSIDITATKKEGTYRFYVKNYEPDQTGKITETNLRYWVEIKSTVTDPTISYELYKNGEQILLNENKTTEVQEMNRQKKQQDTYELKIKYEKEKSTQMQDILEKIQIKVHSEQQNA